MRYLRIFILIVAVFLAGSGFIGVSMPLSAAADKTTAGKGAAGTKKKGASSQKSTPVKKTPKKKTAKRQGARKPARRETSSGVRQRQQSVDREIHLTTEQIKANDVAVSTNLATLQTLDRDVDAQRRRVIGLREREQQLQTNINVCITSIYEGECKLKEMRERYVQAVRKMRVARKRTNSMAFVFASRTFYQALRRMRYLRVFADWRKRREDEIKREMERLEGQRKQLAVSRAALQTTLSQQEEASRVLAVKQREQAATVSRLRANGYALRSHLARKQAEANALNARVAQLIAAERAEAEAAERRRKEQAAREAAEKAERERLAAERAEQARVAAEKAAAEREAALARETAERESAAREQARKEKTARDKAAKEKAAQEKAAKAKAAKEAAAKDKAAKEAARKEQARKAAGEKKAGGGDESRYADARRRRPRSPEKPATSAPAPKAGTPTQSGFASAKGGLPRPVSGTFNIISRFGRRPLPNMPEVMYDNLGIDAEVQKGAAARAVYPGTVSGVFAIPGYNTVVIINHGEYYTVYGNIGSPSVKKGEKVKSGQPLGNLMADPSEGGRTIIHFEVWHNREKLNPEAWIR